jgi:hypothetical protein
VRKLRPAEIAVLVAGMAIGNGNVNADEPGHGELATVTVTGTQQPQLNFVWSTPSVYLDISNNTTPPLNGVHTAGMTAEVINGMKCAMAYGSLPGWAGGSFAQPRSGWSTYFVNDWAFTDRTGIIIKVSQTTSAHPPSPPASGGPWYDIQGLSTPLLNNPFNLGHTEIYLNATVSPELLVETFAHEWSHQWGLTDNGTGNVLTDATAYGAAVAAQYKGDGGRKCGAT